MEQLSTQSPATGLSFRRLSIIARRQWWVVIACVLLAALGSVAYVKSRTATYTASAVVTVSPPSFVSAGSPSTGTSSSPSTSTLFEGTLDPSQQVAAKPVVAAATAAGKEVPTALTATVSADQTTVAVAATGTSAAQAAAMANAAADAFVRQRIGDLNAASASLTSTLNKLNTQITKLQAAIKRAGIGGNTGDDKIKLQVLNGEVQTYDSQQQTLATAADWTALSTRAVPVAATANSNSRRTVAVAVLAGLLAGLGIALAREQFDDKLRSSSEVPEIGSVDVLAELPRSDLGSKSATIGDKPYGELAEAVRDLRTALRFLSVKRPIRTLLVTSARSGEGKSFVAANLAAAWAISGVRTVLVSSDLRRPSLERLFKIEAPRRGLSEAIIDAALSGHERSLSGWSYTEDDDSGVGEEISDSEVDGLLVPTGVEGLSLLPSGPTPPNPAELLGSPEFGKLLVALRERAEVVVLDSPPILAVTDALVLTAQADGVLLVVAENRTSRSAAQRALRQLDSGLAPVLGVVVNRSSRPDSERY